MLNLFLELIDRAINLTERKNKRTIASIVKLVDPIFIELRNIHQNYLDVFNNILIKFENNDADTYDKIKLVINDLKKDRIELLSIREEIQTLANDLKDGEFDETVIEFFIAVDAYFPTERFDYGKPSKDRSAFSGLLGDMVRSSSSNKRLSLKTGKPKIVEISKKQITKEICGKINAYIESKRNLWKDVCEKYSAVKKKEVSMSI
jgi:hypothetical protein